MGQEFVLLGLIGGIGGLFLCCDLVKNGAPAGETGAPLPLQHAVRTAAV